MDSEELFDPWWRELSKPRQPATTNRAEDFSLWMTARLQGAQSNAMSPFLLQVMVVAYVTTRRTGPIPIDLFVGLFPGAGVAEREVLVGLNGDFLAAEAAGEDMESVFDEIEILSGAALIREIQRLLG